MSELEKANLEKYLVFSIMDKLYSFPSRYIGEIALYDTVYPLPLMPFYVPGIINRYSIPYALFDISLLFFKTPGLCSCSGSCSCKNSRKKILIFKDEIDRIACLIDDVTGIADVEQEKVFPIGKKADSNDINAQPAEAVCASFNWNGNDVFVIDIHQIIPDNWFDI